MEGDAPPSPPESRRLTQTPYKPRRIGQEAAWGSSKPHSKIYLSLEVEQVEH